MSKEELKNMILWIEKRLLFVNRLIQDARATSNYGKEMHFIAQKEVYLELLDRLQQASASQTSA